MKHHSTENQPPFSRRERNANTLRKFEVIFTGVCQILQPLLSMRDDLSLKRNEHEPTLRPRASHTVGLHEGVRTTFFHREMKSPLELPKFVSLELREFRDNAVIVGRFVVGRDTIRELFDYARHIPLVCPMIERF